MFGPDPAQRLFGLPPGADFPFRVADGVRDRLAGDAPEALARVTIYANSARMLRRLRDAFAARGTTFLPRLRLVTDPAADPTLAVASEVSPLRRRLELSALILRLLDLEPGLAPRSAAFALADSLARLLAEMQDEAVAPGALTRIDLSRFSEYWERSRRFLALIEPLAAESGSEGRQRRAVEALAARWSVDPPADPVIVAGSTGSRGTTLALMAAVAGLPRGAVILPGFDFDMRSSDWAELDGGDGGTATEDHPQYRHLRVAQRLGTAPDAVRRWDDHPPPCPERNRLVSLSLRPAPATDAWLDEGPRLSGIGEATAGLTLVEAPNPRLEATAIAWRLRMAVEQDETAALVTPDRQLARRVAAQLDRWRIVPDDSGGQPLALSPPGRLLLQVASLFRPNLDGEAILALLKHPLCGAGDARGDHLRHTRDLELHLRRNGPAYPDPDALRAWSGGRADRSAWADWVAQILRATRSGTATAGSPIPLGDHLGRHLALAALCVSGPSGAEDELWAQESGAEARAAMDELSRDADAAPAMTSADYLALLRQILEGREVRRPETARPGVMIWGTLEARAQGADLVILGGLNEGIWPAAPAPDPWLNRQMRREAGLLLPERQIGLSAHDFQQAIAARRVVLSRALRDSETETVPSRWLNRLTTLLDGIPAAGGRDALVRMRARGAELVAAASALDDVTGLQVPPARRPAPRPPVAARFRQLSVTEVEKLIRDPYAVYAKRILGLVPLDPLRPHGDPRLRGTALHKVLETFFRDRWAEGGDLEDALRTALGEILEIEAPWPAIRVHWAARFDRIVPWLISTEIARRESAVPTLFEQTGRAVVGASGVELSGKADRIDIDGDGAARIYDYKTGSVPSTQQVRHFDKQLPLLAALVQRGAFPEIGAREVADVAYIRLGGTPEVRRPDVDLAALDRVWSEFEALLLAYLRPTRGFTSRRAAFRETGAEAGDYDHLARYGEWDGAQPPEPEDVG